MNHPLLGHSGHDSGGPGFDSTLERYFDGLLSPQEAGAFESRLRADPSLQAEVDAQRALDASLRRRFAVPQDIGAAEQPPTAAAPRAAGSPRRSVLARIGWGRIAAALLLGGMGVLVLVVRSRSAAVLESPGEAYREISNAGFQPYVVCTDQVEFAHYTKEHLGQAMTVATAADVKLIGWNMNGEVLSEETDSLLATVGGERVIVFMDHKRNRRSLPKESEGLRVFRRTVGRLELVEVSPLDRAHLLDGFRVEEQ